jgi:hypothetical protein
LIANWTYQKWMEKKNWYWQKLCQSHSIFCLKADLNQEKHHMVDMLRWIRDICFWHSSHKSLYAKKLLHFFVVSESYLWSSTSWIYQQQNRLNWMNFFILSNRVKLSRNKVELQKFLKQVILILFLSNFTLFIG